VLTNRVRESSPGFKARMAGLNLGRLVVCDAKCRFERRMLILI
jgi:ribosomal protein L34